MSTARPHGRIVWHECLTTDQKKAIDFYTKLIGWTITTMPGPEPYHQWTNNGKTLGGSMTLPKEAQQMGAPSHWLMYIGVDDVDRTHAEATRLGAKTFVKPTEIPTVGTFAVLADPQGALFAIYKPAGEPAGHDNPPGIGEFSWHELATTDHEAALRFYQQLFGWEKRATHDMGPMGMYQIFGRAGVTHDEGGMFNRPPDLPVSAWNNYISVKDLDGTTAKAKQLGATVMMEPMEVPGGDRIAMLQDPTGAVFALHAR